MARVRTNPSSIPTRCCGSSEAGSNSEIGNIDLWEHRHAPGGSSTFGQLQQQNYSVRGWKSEVV